MISKPLKITKLARLHHMVDGTTILGPSTDLFGDCSDLRGDCTGLSGNCSGLSGDFAEIPETSRPCNISEWAE